MIGTWVQRLVSARPARPAPGQAVVVSIDSDVLAGIAGGVQHVNALEEQLIRCVGNAGLGEYDGQERLSSSRALMYFTRDPQSLIHAIMPVLRTSPLRDAITVRCNDYHSRGL
jgi:hypothetical protein